MIPLKESRFKEFTRGFEAEFKDRLRRWSYITTGDIDPLLHEELVSIVVSALQSFAVQIYPENTVYFPQLLDRYIGKRSLKSERGIVDLLVRMASSHFLVVEVETFKEGRAVLDVFKKTEVLRQISPKRLTLWFMLLYATKRPKDDKMISLMKRRLRSLSSFDKRKAPFKHPIPWLFLLLEIDKRLNLVDSYSHKVDPAHERSI